MKILSCGNGRALFFNAENAFWGFVRQSSTKTLCQTFNQPPNWMSGLMSSLLLDNFFPEWDLTFFKKKKTTLSKKHKAFLFYFVTCYREANWRYSNCIHLLGFRLGLVGKYEWKSLCVYIAILPSLTPVHSLFGPKALKVHLCNGPHSHNSRCPSECTHWYSLR